MFTTVIKVFSFVMKVNIEEKRIIYSYKRLDIKATLLINGRSPYVNMTSGNGYLLN